MKRPTRRSIGVAAATLVVLVAGCARTEPFQPLPALGVDSARVTVSGISSGAYMAQQVHFALNDRVTGAGLIAGGPYGCARGDLDTALSACMAPEQAPDVAALAEQARARAGAGRIAALTTFAEDRAWVFHGSLDRTVAAGVTEASAEIYRVLMPGMAIKVETAIAAGHTFPTVDQGVECALTESPYIGRCGYDAVAALFEALFDLPLAPAAAPQGRLIAVDQAAFDASGAPASMDGSAWLYVPPRCEAGGCGLHIAFHGCEQSQGKIARQFVDMTGYTGHADRAGVVVLFPQARASFSPLNPKACWDWWGYTGADYDTRDGAQIRVVAAMIDRLAQTPAR
jgi:poly(3-hydroxybutyrate) depolymerase